MRVWLAVLLVIVLLGGCAIRREAAPGKPEPEAPPPATARVTVYFGDKQAVWLVPEVREVPVTEDANLPLVALKELVRGPTSSDLVRVIPEGTRVLSVEVKDGVAYANFSRELQSKHWGGSTGETFTVYAIVNTLTEFPEIEKVMLLIEGQVIGTLAGHLITSEPLSRNEEMIKKGK